MLRGKRKSALFFLLFTISILLAPNLNVIRNFTVSATPNSDSVNLQKANVLWEKTYGGTGDDRAFYATTAGDGYLVVGSSTSLEQGKTLGWVLRLDHDGNALWNRTYSDADSEFRYVLNLTDGFLLVGNMFLPSGNIDGYVVKIDDNGALKWNVTVGGAKVDKLFSAAKTQDGFLLVGLTYSFNSDNESDVWVVKINLNGNVIWNKTYGWSMDDAGRAIAQTADNNYVVAGYTDSVGNGDYDFLLLKIDANGNMIWSKTYGGTQSDMAYAIVAAPDGCVVAGDTHSKGAGDSDAWVIKVDLNGNLLWDTTAGGSGFDMPSCITASSSGGYLVGGFTFSFGNGQRDFWLFKINDSGNVLWSTTVGRSGFEEAYAVLETAENEFVMVGWTNSIGQGHYDFYLVKISVENSSDGLSASQFVTSALILVVIVLSVLIVLFFLIRRYVNQKISRQNVDSVLKRDA
jgi:hypothetical protein